MDGVQRNCKDKTWRALISNAANKPMETLGETSKTQVGESVDKTNITCTPHQYYLYGRVARRKRLFEKSPQKSCACIFLPNDIID